MISQTQLLIGLGAFALIDILVRNLTWKSSYVIKKKAYFLLACFDATCVFTLITIYVPGYFEALLAAFAALTAAFVTLKGFIHCPKCGHTSSRSDATKTRECPKCQTDLII